MTDTRLQTDQIYATPNDVIDGFSFDEKVVAVFPDMIRRSVPGYSTILHMIEQITARYAQHGTHCYDLGCSLGAATLAMHKGIGEKDCTLIGIDNSQEMINECQRLISQTAVSETLGSQNSIPSAKDAKNATESYSKTNVILQQQDIRQMQFKPCSVVVLNFTLQFLPVADRAELLQKISAALVPGGVLILSEKLAFNDPQHHELMIDLHHNFKRNQGYSQLEIAQKRQALENVLIPETFSAHQTRLMNNGFNSVDLWFQCFNFASMLAFK